MKREPISTLTSPAGASQPLLTPVATIADNNDNKEVDIGLRTFSQILAADMINQSVVLLPTSGSIQTDVPRESDGKKTEVELEYQSLAADDEHAELYQFLESFGVTRQYIDQARIPNTALWKLYQQEFSCFSWMKWSSLDHAIEKHLQWPLLSLTDIGLETPQKCNGRVRPYERSVLLKTTGGLIKAYAVRGFVQGIEMGLLESVHYFIYGMLAYRLGELAHTGQSNFEEFQAIFSSSSQKGIDSLVRSLAGLEARWLKLILATPGVLGVMQGILRMRGVRSISTTEMKKIADRTHIHLEHPGSIWRDIILEKILLLFNFFSLSSRVQKLEQWVRWDGRLDPQSRKQAFELIRRVAREGDKITQLNALESLAKIAHGIGLKDLPRLRQAGYSPAELVGLLAIKATALVDLIELSSSAVIEDNKAQSGKRRRLFTSAPRRLYASYLLWWLGQSTSWWTQRLPFTLLKIVKLGLEALFLQKIAVSILEAIACPDKPGFQFGNGYQDWASDYTVECFTTRVKFFRTIDINESITVLVGEIPQYHLTELTTLSLSNKYLTEEEASQIVQAVIQQGAPLQTLDLDANQISALSESMFSGLNQLANLDLSYNQINVLSEGVFSGLSQLTNLDLYVNRISVLSEGVFSGLSQLTIMKLGLNQINVLSEGVFSGLSQLTHLDLYDNRISVFSQGVFSGLSQLANLDLNYNQISVLSEGVFSGLSQLTHLDLYDNRISVLSEGMFSGLSQLTTLSLGLNRISVLNEGVFSGLSQLTDLELSHNRISVLNKSVFSELSQLQALDLSNNWINTNTIVSVLVSLPVTLTELDISANQIDALPQNFSALLPVGLTSLLIGRNRFIPSVLTPEFMAYFPFRLTVLGLDSSFIKNIAAGSFSNFSALTTLDLYDNRINVLSEGVFSGLSQLIDLELSGNQISILNEDVFSGLSQLTGLVLISNQISVLSEGVFSGLSQLIYLDLHGNQINALSEGVFSELSQLTVLGFGFNPISVFNEGAFSGLSQLTDLYLNSNQISVLSEGVFSGLTQLTYLDLSDNRIRVLSEGVFSELSQLTDLDLSYNQINVLSEGVFSELSQLTDLDLSYNQINVLSEGVFSEFSQLTSLDLWGNLLNDTAIQNLTRNFPYQLITLDVSHNQIGNDGALALAKILPCTNLTTIDFVGNPANDTTLAIVAQQAALQKVCDDQRCHANLPATESCGVNTNPSTTGQIPWRLFGNASGVDETKVDLQDTFYWPSADETSSFQPLLALPSTTSESASLSLTPAVAGALILGVAGLSILLYKNSTWIQAIVNNGSNLFQRCWSSRKTEEVKTTSPVSSSNRRYTLFPSLLTICSRKSSSITTTPFGAPR
jgi:Leucine-rich repeat (LRR) protein